MQVSQPMRCALASVFLFSGLAFGQGAEPLKFEIATIKPHPPGDNSSRISLVNGGVDATNVTVLSLMRQAYGVQEYQILGAPKWVADARWDIQARTPDFTLTTNEADIPGPERVHIREQMLERMRTLLKDRFQLITHDEMRQQPIYTLTVAKGGPRLMPTQGTGVDTVDVRGSDGRTLATYKGATMDTLARSLASRIGRPVVNKTELIGYFDFKLEWASEMAQPIADETTGSSTPTIFTALPEQIGIRIESQKAPAKILVIEKIEKPSSN